MKASKFNMLNQLLSALNPAQWQASLDMQLARAVAFAVKKMAASEAWVSSSAQPNQDKVIAVSFPLLGQTHQLCWRVDAHEILEALDADLFFEHANVTLTVQPTLYANLTLPLNIPQLMRHVHISGDAQLAEWVNTLAQRLRPEVWEELAKLIGDVPSHYVERGIKTITQHIKQATSSLTEQAQYILLDETPVMIRHATLDNFASEALNLRYGVERLEQRIARLQQQVSRS
jgi:ubiquinone biosynthesis protein UbiJ